VASASASVGFAPVGDYAGPRWFGVPREAVHDAARLYLLAIPLSAVASFYEFMAIPR